MRHSLKGKNFTGDTDKGYVQRNRIKLECTHSPSTKDMYPIVTEGRVIAAIDLLKKARKQK